MIVKAEVALRGLRSFEKCKALVDTGAIMTVIDKGLERDERETQHASAVGDSRK